MTTPTTRTKMTNNQKAQLRVATAILAGRILRAYNALDNEETTCGPYRKAVDDGVRFAVIGWRGVRYSEVVSARDAAWLFVERVGSGRAREAAIKAGY